MVDMSMIVGAVGSLKSAVDIAKTVKEINDISVVRDKVIEMQDLILSAQASAVSAQSQLMEMIQENGELKTQSQRDRRVEGNCWPLQAGGLWWQYTRV